METLIYAVGITGSVLLLAFTGIIIWLNWSDKTLNPLLSIALVGTATLLVSVGFPLKASVIESAFATPVVIDTANGSPPLPNPEPNSPVVSELQALAMIGSPTVKRGGVDVRTVPAPSNVGERFDFGAKLLQYRLIRVIEEIQRGSSTFGFSFGASIASVNEPLHFPEPQDYSPQQLIADLADNPFSKSDYQHALLKHARLPLPKGTKISLASVSTPAGESKYVVRLEKPLFFRIELGVKPMGGTSLGLLPAGVTLPQDIAARCETYHYNVNMRADFRRITAGNSDTDEYKDWVHKLFDRVRDTLSSD